MLPTMRDSFIYPAACSDLDCSIDGAAMCALPAQALSCMQLRAACRQNYVPNFKKAFERFLLHTSKAQNYTKSALMSLQAYGAP